MVGDARRSQAQAVTVLRCDRVTPSTSRTIEIVALRSRGRRPSRDRYLTPAIAGSEPVQDVKAIAGALPASRACEVSAGSAANARRIERAGVGFPRLAQLSSLRQRARCACSRARSCFCVGRWRVTRARRRRVLYGSGAPVGGVTDEFSSPPWS